MGIVNFHWYLPGVSEELVRAFRESVSVILLSDPGPRDSVGVETWAGLRLQH